MVAADDLHPHGQAVEVPTGTEIAGLPVTLAGIVSAPLFSRPTFGRRPAWLKAMCAGKATSGLVAAMTKSTSSNTAAIASLASVRACLGPSGHLEVQRSWARSRPKAISALRSSRQAGHGRRAPAQPREVADGPLEARARAVPTGTSTSTRPASCAELLAGLPDAAPRPRAGPLQRRAWARATDPPAPQVVGAEVALPALDAGQRVRVAGVVARRPRRTSGPRRAPSAPGSRARPSSGRCRCGARGGCARPCPSCRAGHRTRRGCGSSRRRRLPMAMVTSPPATAADAARRRAAGGAAVLPRVVGDAVRAW